MRYRQKFPRLVLTTLPLIVTFLAVLCPRHAAGGGVATFQGIGDLPGGGFFSNAFGVSSDGSTVVGSSLSSADPDSFEAVRWTALGGMVSLGEGAIGLERGRARAVSADGAVVVGEAHLPGVHFGVPFRWTALTGVEVLVDTTGSMTRGTAFDVSDDGAVIVGVGSTPGPNQVFRWEASSGMVGLGWLPASFDDSYGFGVSADGSAVCGMSFSGTTDTEPFRWTLPNGMVGVGDVPGGIFHAIAFAISGDGTTLVGPARTSFGVDELFIWSQSSGFILPDSLHGATFASTAWSVNYDGTVVVGFASSGPMIWDAANGMRNLQDVLTIEFGLDLTGWTLGTVRGISADGTVIVGTGTNPDGNTEGWIATMPRTATGISTPPATHRLRLTPAYPNPFGSSAEFLLETRESFHSLRVTVYGVDGAVVRVLINGSYPAGAHRLMWDGRDGRGHRVPLGVYFLRVAGGGDTVTRKLVLLR